MNNPTIELLENRASLRKFADKPIEKEKEDIIISAALRAPSTANRMHYSIIKVTDRDLLKQIQEDSLNQPYISKCAMFLIFCADEQRYIDWYQANAVKEKCEENGLQFHYPDEGNFYFATIDAVLAAHNAVIAAEALGIGSCYMGHIVSYIEKYRERLSLPPYVFPATAVMFGYPEEGHRVFLSSRFDRKYIYHENNRYERFTPQELEDCFSVFNCPEGNRYHAENRAQYSYITKYAVSDAYLEWARSIREAMKNWSDKWVDG